MQCFLVNVKSRGKIYTFGSGEGDTDARDHSFYTLYIVGYL